MDLNISVMNMTEDLDLPAGSGFAGGLAPQPPDHAEEHRHRDNQPWIARRNAHVAKDQNIAQRDQQHGHHGDVKRSIHTEISFRALFRVFTHPAGTARWSYRSPTRRCP